MPNPLTQLAALPGRFRAANPQLKRFFIAMGMLGIAAMVFESTFNNYINDIFSPSATTRGELEFWREMPGFLCALLAGLLFFMSETSIAAIAALIVGLGLTGLGLLGNEWMFMLMLTIFWSIGAHLMMPVSASISMDLAEKGQLGRRMGQIQAVGCAAAISGCGLVYFILRPLAGRSDITLSDYTPTFLVGAVAAFIAAIAFFTMKMPGAHIHRSKMVVRKRYWLFYVLALLFGARKQLFITFGPWVLVKIFHQPPSTIALLMMIGMALQVFFLPILGKLIDRLGERTVLMADSAVILLICAGYGLAHLAGSRNIGLGILYTCFVADLMMFGVNMARSTYVSKIAAKGEVTSTLSVGVTINHAASMSLPIFGGMIWDAFGHQWVFAAAAGVAILMGIFSSKIPSRAELLKLKPAA